MAEAAGSNNMDGAYPIDLLQRFISAKNYFPGKVKEENEAAEGEGEEAGIELSLGLSLNGQFGVDPRANKLARSSSIPEFMNHPWTITSQESPRVTQEMMMMPLMRTCSLPLETEEWKKRKALQSLRRMEAKRKRTEKQRNLRMMRCRDGSSVEDSNNWGAVENDGCVVVPTTVNCVSSDFGGERNNGLVGGEGGGGGGEGLLRPPLSSQGSGGSGSSGVSEAESLAGRGIISFSSSIKLESNGCCCLIALIDFM